VLALGADEDGAAWAAFERRVSAEDAVFGVRYTDSDPQLPGHPLYLAALLDLPRAAARLLALGASAAAPFAGESPLEAAAKRGSRRALAVLLGHVAAIEKVQRDRDDEVEGERRGALRRAEQARRRRPPAEDDGAGVDAPDDDGAGSDAAADARDADAGGDDGRPPLRRVWTHTLAAGRAEVRLHRVPTDERPELSSDESRGPLESIHT